MGGASSPGLCCHTYTCSHAPIDMGVTYHGRTVMSYLATSSLALLAAAAVLSGLFSFSDPDATLGFAAWTVMASSDPTTDRVHATCNTPPPSSAPPLS